MDESIYVGRPSLWGNPYVIGRDGSREEVIEKFRKLAWSKGQKAWRNRVRQELTGKKLRCWCEPLPCHKEVLVEITLTPLED